jgi:hypothetical protein
LRDCDSRRNRGWGFISDDVGGDGADDNGVGGRDLGLGFGDCRAVIVID